MDKIRVYISSTFLDMADVRKFIIDKIQNQFQDFFELSKVMEQMKGDFYNRANVDFCLDEVRDADLYILLTGNRYGSSPAEYYDEDRNLMQNAKGLSYTELEYESAKKTLDKKCYGIYQFHLSEAFFEENNFDPHSDTDISERKTKLKSFVDTLQKKNNFIEVNNLVQFNLAINNKLYDFKMHRDDFLRIQSKDYNKINRNNQISIIQSKLRPAAILDPILGEFSRCVVLVFNTIGESDNFDRFNFRIKDEIINPFEKRPLEIYDLINELASIAGNNDHERILLKMLRSCSTSLIGKMGSNLSFDNFYEEFNKDSNKDLRYVCIRIATDKNNALMNQKCFEIITRFISKIETILKEKGYVSNIFFSLALVEKDLQESQLNEYLRIIEDLLPNIECVNLNKLGMVSSDDVKKWISNIIEVNNLNKPLDDIYKFIFNGDETEKYYRDCVKQIEKRTL